MKLFPVFLFFTFVNLALGADLYFVEPTTGNGVSRPDATAATDIVKHEAAKHVTLTKLPDSAKYFLIPKLLRLGSSYILSLQKETVEGKVLFRAQVKASRIEELDIAASRLVRAVIAEQKPKARLGEITREETTRPTLRRGVRRGSYIGIGPAWLYNLNRSGLAYYVSGAYSWDVNTAIIRVRTDLAVSGGALYLDGGLGLIYFLSESNLAPFIGAEFGVGLARIDVGNILNSDTVTGFTVGANAGIQVLRTTAINIEIAARFSALLHRGTLGNPMMFGFRIGLYF